MAKQIAHNMKDVFVDKKKIQRIFPVSNLATHYKYILQSG